MSPASGHEPPADVPHAWTALVVEDEMMIAGAIEDLLIGMGAAEVVVAHGPAEALTLLVGRRFAVALVDWRFGRVTAAALIGALRSAGTGVIVVTGADPRDIRAAVGPDLRVVEKPYRDATLEAAVREALAATLAAPE